MKAEQSEDEAWGGGISHMGENAALLPAAMLCRRAASHRPSSAHPLPSAAVLLRGCSVPGFGVRQRERVGVRNQFEPAAGRQAGF